MKGICSTIFKGAVIFLLLLAACSQAPKTSAYQASEYTPTQESVAQENKVLTIRYSNQSTSIKMDVDPFDEDLYIDMKGGKHTLIQPPQAHAPQPVQQQPQPIPQQSTLKNESKNEDEKKVSQPTILIQREEIERSVKQMQPAPLPEKMNDKILSNIQLAQEFFYKKQYDDALDAVNQSLQIQPTAEGYALLGSIYYMMGEKQWAIHNWKNALNLNPNMIEIQKMLEKIKRDDE